MVLDFYEDKYLKYKKKYISLLNKKQENQKNQIENKNNIQIGGSKKIKNKESEYKLYFFKADWCGHCQNFKPIWNQLKKKYKKDFEFIEMDSETNKKEFLDWGIQGFPTIIFRKNSDAVEYGDNRDLKSISKFCDEMKKKY